MDVQKLPCAHSIIPKSTAARHTQAAPNPRAIWDASFSLKAPKNAEPTSVCATKFFHTMQKPTQDADTARSPNAPAAKSKCVGSMPPPTPSRSTKDNANQKPSKVSTRAPADCPCS